VIPSAELKVRVAIDGIPQTNAKLAAFEGNLKRVSGYDATANLQANVEGRGFEEYQAYIDRARVETARPISQTVKADVDQSSFAGALAEVAALKRKIDSASGGGLGSHLLGVATPFGKLPSLIALASPEVLALAGAAGALAASLSEAAIGAGALAVGGGGMATVGIAGITAVAAPAVGALKDLTKAQGSYIEAVETYGVQSTQAETAGRKLLAAEKSAGKEAVNVVRGLDNVKERWESLSKPGREAFLGALSDGLDHLEAKLPILSKSANRSTKAMRKDFDLFLDEVTGKGSGFDHFIDSMTDLFVNEGPMVTHILADWAKVFEHIAEAAGPSLEEVTEDLEDWSDGILKSTEDAPKLRTEVGHLVDQTESWVHMLAQATDLVIAIFGPGAGEGQDMVDGMTGKLEGWRRAIEADPEKVEGFFEHSVETTGEFLGILGMIAEQWFVVAQAMEPVDEGIHDIATALNSIRIGNVSGLTLLLGAFTGLALGKKAVELADLLKAYKGIQSVMKGEAALADVLAGREVAAAGRVAAANYGVVDSIAAQQTAQRELLIANSSGAITGSVPIGGRAAGEAEAGMMAKGLGLALPAAIAGIGIANIVTSATAGDWHDAGWEAGGSLAGGVAGFFVGGPAGAMIGAGVGSVLGEAFDHGLADAFEGHGSQHHLEQVGEEQAEQFIHGWNRHRKQIRKEISTGFLGQEGTEPHTVAGPSSYVPGFGTVQGSSALVGGRKGTGLRGRRQELKEAIHQDASPAATKVFERELAAVEKAIAATKRARATFAATIDQMQGDIALGMGAVNQDLARGLDQADTAWEKGTKPWRAHTAEAMEDAVTAIRTGIDAGIFNAEEGQKRINELLARIHLVKGNDPFGLAEATAKTFKHAGAITEDGVRKWVHQLGEMPPAARSTAIDATNKMLHAWADGHPKLERQIDALTAMEIQKFGATNQQLREGVKKGATGPVAEAFRQMALGNMDALDNLGVNVNRMLKALGAKDLVQFQAMVLGPARHSGTQLNSDGGGANFAGNSKHHELAIGGRVPGVTEGDSVERIVPPNTFILNREASRHFFQDGGHVPVVLEPGEIEFTPEQVGSIGLDTLLWMNSAVPRFANGGEVSVSGPRALATMGHAGLAHVVTAMNRYVDAHRPKVGAGGVNVPAGKGTEMMDGHPVADWIWKILEAARHAGVDFTVSSGWRSDAEQVAIYESGVRPAAVPKALGGSGSNHEGTAYPAGAVDISPGAEALDAWLEHSRWANTLIYAGAKDPVHFSHPHGGGYQQGGAVGLQQGGAALHGPPLFGGEGPEFYAAALAHNQKWATHQAPWSTKLSRRDERAFRSWGGRPWAGGQTFFEYFGFDPDRRRNDYDMRGFWRATGGSGPAGNGHFSDRWKTPFDTTFSSESKYAKPGTPFVWTPDGQWLYDRRSGQEIASGRYQRGGVVGLQGGGQPYAMTGAEALEVPTHIAPTPPSKSTKEAEAAKSEEVKPFTSATETQKNAALHAARRLLGYGLNDKGTSGVVGNAWRESKWNPGAIGTGGRGFWGFDFFEQQLLAQAAAKGVSWSDLDFQTNFMWSGPAPASALKSALNSQPDAAAAARFFDSEWEKSGIKAMPEREDGAREVMRLLGAGGIGGEYDRPGRPAEPKQVKGKYTYPGYAPKGTKAGGLEAKKVTRHGHYKVATEHLSFGSLPDNLKACNDELHHRRKQLREYRGALGDTEDNRVRRDLEFNIAALEERIRKLKRQRVKLIRKREQGRRDRRVKHEVERIEGMADFSAWTDPATGIFAREEAAFDLAEERASQAVELEPEEPRVPGSATGNEARDILGRWIEHVLAPYVEGTETARYQDVLGVEASWRNSIIGAEAFAEKRIGDWGGRIEHLNDRIGETRERIHKQTDRVHHIQDRIKEILGLKETNPTAWEKHKDELPDLRAKVQKLHGKIGRERGEIPGFEQFIAALTGDITKTQTETLPEWEQMLGGVQGLGRGHEVLGSLPGDPSTQFGGDIFQTQMTIHELGLKVPNAIAALPEPEKPEGPDRTEQVELELQLSRQANQRLSIENALLPALSQFEHSYPLPYMGAFADGGVALVGERGPELAHFPSGTRVHTAADTQSMLAPSLHVVVNGDIRQEPGDTRPPIEAWLADPRNQKIIQRIAVATPRPLSNTAPGRAYSA
jgi:hypothetical protein